MRWVDKGNCQVGGVTFQKQTNRGKGRRTREGMHLEARQPVRSNFPAAKGKEKFQTEVFTDTFFEER